MRRDAVTCISVEACSPRAALSPAMAILLKTAYRAAPTNQPNVTTPSRCRAVASQHNLGVGIPCARQSLASSMTWTGRASPCH